MSKGVEWEWTKTPPQASSVKFHSSASSAARVVSENADSMSLNWCRSGGASPESAKVPAALVPPLSFPARLPAFDEGEHSRPDRTLRNLRATGDARGSYAES